MQLFKRNNKMTFIIYAQYINLYLIYFLMNIFTSYSTPQRKPKTDLDLSTSSGH